MYSSRVFCCLIFLNTVYELQADPMRCFRRNEILDCVFPCPPEETCGTRGSFYYCQDPIDPCRPKCVCKPGFYRNPNGECVTEGQCDQCPGKHEFFSCGSACQTKCSTLGEQCPIVNIKCNDQCYCENGYARNEYGECIPLKECPSIQKTAPQS